MRAEVVEVGVFRDFQPIYDAIGIATFPFIVTPTDKRPLIKGYQNIGLTGSRKLAAKFAEADAFAFCAGEVSGIAVLDVDTPDEAFLRRALEKFGETPFLVRTGSGNFQAWYRWNGEQRRIRPSAEPFDVLGSGAVIAPPSRGSRRSYEIISGRVEDLQYLPSMRFGAAFPRPVIEPRVGEGQREGALWRHLMRQAHYCDTEEDLMDVAFTFANERLDREDGHRFTDAEIMATVRAVWKRTCEGKNFFGTGGVVPIPREIVGHLAGDDPYAYALHSILRMNHADRPEFVVANAMAKALNWTLPRFKAARSRLVREQFIVCIDRGGRGPGDPPRYRWP